MSRSKNGGQGGLFDDRQIGAHLLTAIGLVVLGTEPEQRIGIDMMIDCIKTDYMSAKRMLRVIDSSSDMAQRFPEIRALCLHQIKSRI